MNLISIAVAVVLALFVFCIAIKIFVLLVQILVSVYITTESIKTTVLSAIVSILVLTFFGYLFVRLVLFFI